MQRIDFDSASGLPEIEAAHRLKEEGFNELPSSNRRNAFRIILDVAKEPMFLLLLAGGLIYFFLGDLQEGLMLMSFVIVIIAITTYQEQRTEKALEALKNLSSPRALVVRDGKRRRIPGREVVRGDILIFSEGDRVPADALLIRSNNLMVDESILTGESVPVRKIAGDGHFSTRRPGGDDQPFVYSGTLIVQGQALGEVKATGIKTEMGKIGRALQTISREETKLSQAVGRLIRNVALVGLCLCAITVVIYGLTRFDWIHGVLAGITLAMAILPEEFPVILTIFLAVGAWRISRKNVLTRQIAAIEQLGATTVLCVDKTGTLTQNKMSVNAIFANGQVLKIEQDGKRPVSEHFHELSEFSILACKKESNRPYGESAIRIW